MTQHQPINFRPDPPTLRVDSLHARRQSQDAVILPIVYEFAKPNCGGFNSDSIIIPINWPLNRSLRQFTTSIIPLEIPGNDSDRKKKLALLKKKVESARERAVKARTIQTDKQTDDNSAKPDRIAKTESKPVGKTGCSPTAVPLLLLSAILLVVFAWTCFR